mmetsp:Transcript_21696/g.69963  ORF Transcript_21696/g.69963 Transcript_21696/m.69963 type:complete len:144 (-) Transcript_21696:195-626(-)
MSKMLPEGGSIIFWTHDPRSRKMAPVVLKIPMNMAIPIFKVVELGPPPETMRPGFELSDEFEPEIWFKPTSSYTFHVAPAPITSPRAQRLWEKLKTVRLADGRTMLPACVFDLNTAYYYQRAHLVNLRPANPTALAPVAETPN